MVKRKQKYNKSVQKESLVETGKLILTGDPEETHPVQAISWYFDPNDLYYYIFLGSNKNPLTNTFGKVFIIQLSNFSAYNFYKSSEDFFSKMPKIENLNTIKILQNSDELLKSQIAKLFSSYITFPCHAIKISCLGGDADLTCFALYPSHFVEVKEGFRKKLVPCPVVRFTCGLETLIYFIQQIKETSTFILDETKLLHSIEDKNEKKINL
jgi:hypothetical protein